MSVATFKMGFYPLYLKSYEKFTFLMSVILDCKLQSSCANSQMSPDCFEIGIPKLPYKPILCFYHSF